MVLTYLLSLIKGINLRTLLQGQRNCFDNKIIDRKFYSILFQLFPQSNKFIDFTVSYSICMWYGRLKEQGELQTQIKIKRKAAPCRPYMHTGSTHS